MGSPGVSISLRHPIFLNRIICHPRMMRTIRLRRKRIRREDTDPQPAASARACLDTRFPAFCHNRTIRRPKGPFYTNRHSLCKGLRFKSCASKCPNATPNVITFILFGAGAKCPETQCPRRGNVFEWKPDNLKKGRKNAHVEEQEQGTLFKVELQSWTKKNWEKQLTLH